MLDVDRAAAGLPGDAGLLSEVAAAAGVDVATVSHHTGTKAQLYDACFARVFAAERDVLEAAAGRARQALDSALQDIREIKERAHR